MRKKRPTRSEIESALADKTTSKKRPARKLQVPTDHTGRKRRQKVIGGNISGVSSQPKKSPNLLVWVIGILTLMVLGALLIPEPDDKTKKHQEAMEAIKKVDKIYTESRVKEDAEQKPANDEQLFTRETDVERAKEYRIQEVREKEVSVLLEKATQLIEKERYTKPVDNNAYGVYRKILELDSENFQAKEGIQKIEDYYVERIETGIKSNKLKTAKRALDSLKSMNTDDDLIDELKDAIAQKEEANRAAAEQAKIDKIIKQAEDAYKKGDKLSPVKRSALYYYRQVLEIDIDNKAATNGINSIANEYLELANNAIIKDEYEAAKGYLTTVLAINPEHPSISLMEKQIQEKQKQAAINKAQQERQEQQQQQERQQQERQQEEKVQQADTSQEIKKAVVDEQNQNTNIIPRNQGDIDTLNLREGLAAYYLGDYEKSLKLLQPLADKGISRAQFRIGFMYQLGRGVPTDIQKADNIIRSALPAIQKFANEGRAWAQSDLASLYDDGLVLPKDALKAISWYEKAAYQGYAGAQTNLGLMYYYGKGVRTNRELAIEWFKRAARQGDVTAKKNLTALGISVD